MKRWSLSLVFVAGVLAGCMAGGTPLPAQGPPSSSGVPGRGLTSTLANPLIIDRTDLQIGTTVHFGRMPTASEIHDLEQLPRVSHVVLSLPAWPSDASVLEALNPLPQTADVIVVLPGYPPSRSAMELWGFVNVPIRVVVVVDGPPADPNALADLNEMRRLERVIAQMDQPSRSGFERLQRPMSFRKIMS